MKDIAPQEISLLAVLCGEIESRFLSGIPIQSLNRRLGGFGGGGVYHMWGDGRSHSPLNGSGSSILPTPDSEEPKIMIRHICSHHIH